MACCLSKPKDDLPLVEDLGAYQDLPCVAYPKVDESNRLVSMYVAKYEHGMELTLLFSDEDRPNACMDVFYDTIRRPLFGRYSDIETVFVIDNQIEFPGTYSAGEKWKEKTPGHHNTTVPLDKFETSTDGRKTIFINTWNHLMGEQNNNTDMEMTVALPSVDECAASPEAYIVREGSREEVDARFKGFITSVSKVMTKEREERLGKRLA